MDNDRRLIDDILAGRRKAFESLVESYKRLVSHVVFRMVTNETDREDLCQDVFIKVYQNLARFREQSKLSTWIARIAYNTCLNHLEKKRVPLYEDCMPGGETLDSCAGDWSGPEEWTESRHTSVRICEEIDRLPVRYGLILSLYHLQDMSYAEIGGILCMPAGTVKSYLFRARKLLKEKILARYTREELCA